MIKIDPQWSANLFYLLLEMIQNWKELANKPESNIPQQYNEIFSALLAEGVTFPNQIKFLDWPKIGHNHDQEKLEPATTKNTVKASTADEAVEAKIEKIDQNLAPKPQPETSPEAEKTTASKPSALLDTSFTRIIKQAAKERKSLLSSIKQNNEAALIIDIFNDYSSTVNKIAEDLDNDNHADIHKSSRKRLILMAKDENAKMEAIYDVLSQWMAVESDDADIKDEAYRAMVDYLAKLEVDDDDYEIQSDIDIHDQDNDIELKQESVGVDKVVIDKIIEPKIEKKLVEKHEKNKSENKSESNSLDNKTSDEDQSSVENQFETNKNNESNTQVDKEFIDPFVSSIPKKFSNNISKNYFAEESHKIDQLSPYSFTKSKSKNLKSPISNNFLPKDGKSHQKSPSLTSQLTPTPIKGHLTSDKRSLTSNIPKSPASQNDSIISKNKNVHFSPEPSSILRRQPTEHFSSISAIHEKNEESASVKINNQFNNSDSESDVDEDFDARMTKCRKDREKREKDLEAELLRLEKQRETTQNNLKSIYSNKKDQRESYVYTSNILESTAKSHPDQALQSTPKNLANPYSSTLPPKKTFTTVNHSDITTGQLSEGHIHHHINIDRLSIISHSRHLDANIQAYSRRENAAMQHVCSMKDKIDDQNRVLDGLLASREQDVCRNEDMRRKLESQKARVRELKDEYARKQRALENARKSEIAEVDDEKKNQQFMESVDRLYKFKLEELANEKSRLAAASARWQFIEQERFAKNQEDDIRLERSIANNLTATVLNKSVEPPIEQISYLKRSANQQYSIASQLGKSRIDITGRYNIKNTSNFQTAEHDQNFMNAFKSEFNKIIAN